MADHFSDDVPNGPRVTNRGREYAKLVALVRLKGSCETLELVELLKLAESCEAPPTDAGAWQWVQDFAKPLIRELASRLDSSASRNGEATRLLVEAGRRMMQAETAYHTERSKEKRFALNQAKNTFANLLGERQLTLWEEE
jgi:hypothetical protein